jgi:hypothetical protein
MSTVLSGSWPIGSQHNIIICTWVFLNLQVSLCIKRLTKTIGGWGRKLAISQNIHKAVFCDPSNILFQVGTVTLTHIKFKNRHISIEGISQTSMKTHLILFFCIFKDRNWRVYIAASCCGVLANNILQVTVYTTQFVIINIDAKTSCHIILFIWQHVSDLQRPSSGQNTYH